MGRIAGIRKRDGGFLATKSCTVSHISVTNYENESITIMYEGPTLVNMYITDRANAHNNAYLHVYGPRDHEIIHIAQTTYTYSPCHTGGGTTISSNHPIGCRRKDI